MIALEENLQWGSSPRIYVSFYYEKVRDGANMKYRTKTVIEPLTGESYFGYSIEQVLTMDGDEKEYAMLKNSSPSQWGDSIEYVSPWYTISNKVSGTTSVTFNLFSGSGRDDYFDYSMAVDPAATSITSFSVSKRNETSFTFNWATADAVKKVEYSTDNGSTYKQGWANDSGATSGSFTVSQLSANTNSLSPNTTYSCKIRVTRKDSGLTTDSGTVQQTTYKAPTQTLSSKTETSITMSWTLDTTAEYIWYSKDNGSNWTAVGSVNSTSGSYTITTGLSPNTSYNIKTRVKRKSSQTTYDTANLAVSTYDYPYVTAVGSNPLTIGNNQSLTLYNPLGRTVTVKMYQTNTSGTQLYSGTTSVVTGTPFTFTPNANTLYASIPSSQDSYCVYSITYGSSTKTTATNTYKYKIIGNEKPTFSNFTYADTNVTTTALTGNNQILVNGYSNVTATVSVANKATANNSTTMKDYTLSIGNKSARADYSSSNDVTMSVSTINSATIKVTANDNRGLGTIVEKTATFKNYSKPATTSLTATRGNNGVGEAVTLAFSGSWWNDSFGSVANSIQHIKYYFKKSTASSWTTGTTTITFSTSGNTFSGSVAIAGDTSSQGFAAADSYYIKIVVTDQLASSEEFQTTIGAGTPAIAIYKDSVAIAQQYDTTQSSMKFQVNSGALFLGTTVFKDRTGSTSTTEGGEIQLHAPRSNNASAGTIIDNNSSKCRIFGIPSKDGTTKTGAGTPLEIDPYGKTITGNYTMTGTVTNAQFWMPTNEASFTSDEYGNLKHKRSTNTDVWQMKNSAGTVKGEYNWETGIWAAGATKDGDGVQISTNYSRAGVKESVNLNDVGSGKTLQRSGLYSANNGTWYNLINIRHRNGEGDGTSYGMQIISNLTSANATIQVRKQVNNSWTGWEDIIRRKNLYNNTTGTNGTVTLSETSANFVFLDIFYRSNDGNAYVSSTRIYAPNGKYAYLNYTYNSGTNTTMYHKFAQAYINGTSITLSRAKQHSYSNGSNATVEESNNIYIVRVDGCR